jgi:hypothetical protein
MHPFGRKQHKLELQGGGALVILGHEGVDDVACDLGAWRPTRSQDVTPGRIAFIAAAYPGLVAVTLTNR